MILIIIKDIILKPFQNTNKSESLYFGLPFDVIEYVHRTCLYK